MGPFSSCQIYFLLFLPWLPCHFHLVVRSISFCFFPGFLAIFILSDLFPSVSSLASLPFSSCQIYFLLFLPWLPCHFHLVRSISFCFFPGFLAIFIFSDLFPSVSSLASLPFSSRQIYFLRFLPWLPCHF